ncbi:hypothetical protein TWF696_001612 [Orbilia brochopaga]|uniref:Uncharacterized protein n=1 Tax=Orbilia brochopaga TaxID=3140254 RepID=A0AAV9UC56_9PEZI
MSYMASHAELFVEKKRSQIQMILSKMPSQFSVTVRGYTKRNVKCWYPSESSKSIAKLAKRTSSRVRIGRSTTAYLEYHSWFLIRIFAFRYTTSITHNHRTCSEAS